MKTNDCLYRLSQPVPRRPDSSTKSVKQRDLTKAMKAAKAAGLNSYELVIADGLIFRATGEGGLTPTQGDLDAELKKFEARRYG